MAEKKKKAGKIILICIISVIVIALAAVGIYVARVMGIIHQDIPDPTGTINEEGLITATPRPDADIIYPDGTRFDGYVLRDEYYSESDYEDEVPELYSVLKEKFFEESFCFSKMEAVTKNNEYIETFDSEVTLCLTVPYGMDGSKCYVFTSDEEGNLKQEEAVFDDEYLRVKTNKMQAYIISEKNLLIHEHKFSKWEKVDDEIHARTCSCGEEETASHNWNDGEATPAATHLADGMITYTCLDCGAIKTEFVPRIEEHTFTKWAPVDDDVHERHCECGESYTEAHMWDDGVITVEMTAETAGEIVFTCQKCDATKVIILDPADHVHTNTPWEYLDEDSHTCECTFCFEITTEAHTWDDGYVSVAATHLTEGKMLYTCTKCKTTKTAVIPKLSEHAYSAWVSKDANYHTRSCECGDIQEEKHSWGSGKVTNAATHFETGIKTYTCKCGAVKTEVIPKTSEHVYQYTPIDDTTHKGVCTCGADGSEKTENHQWGPVQIKKSATVNETGLQTQECKVCHYVKEKIIPKLDPSTPVETPSPSLGPTTRKNVVNIMIFGVDAGRTAGSSVTNFSGRSDTMMLLSVDLENNEMTLTSFMRDLLVTYYNSSNKSTGRAGKLTETFARYGVNAAVYTIEHYFNIDIDYYVCVNFAGTMKIFDELGEVEIEMTTAEAKYMFGETGTAGKYWLVSSQAFKYLCIRKIDSDRQRNLRQGNVINAYLQKFYMTPLADLLSMLDDCLQFIRTDMPLDKIYQVATAVYNGRANGFNHNSYPTKYSSFSNYVLCNSCLGRCTSSNITENGKTIKVWTCTQCGHVYKPDASGKYGLSDMGYVCYESNKQMDMDWFHKRILDYGVK